MVEKYIANSERIKREQECCLLSANLAPRTKLKEPENLEVVPAPPLILDNIETFINLNGFFQLYDDELELPITKQKPLLILSQPEVENVETGAVATIKRALLKDKEVKMSPKEMFKNGVTFNNCSFVFHL